MKPVTDRGPVKSPLERMTDLTRRIVAVPESELPTKRKGTRLALRLEPGHPRVQHQHRALIASGRARRGPPRLKRAGRCFLLATFKHAKKVPLISGVRTCRLSQITPDLRRVQCRNATLLVLLALAPRTHAGVPVHQLTAVGARNPIAGAQDRDKNPERAQNRAD